jgi:hypothetical protein
MSSTALLVIIGVIVLAVIVVVMAVVISRSWGFGKPKLKALPPDARDRYGAQWDRVESRFVDDPKTAVREADSILLGLLREREHPMREDQLPARMRKARKLAVGDQGKGGTEGMRLALLEYRGVMEEYGRPAGDRDQREPNKRQELAS